MRTEERRSMFRGNELPRLMTMLAMLAVLFMLIQRARDPGMWKWLVDDSGGGASRPAETQTPTSQAKPSTPSRQTAKKEVPPPLATGPTDQDPDEASAVAEEFQAVTDGTLEIQVEEMKSYKRILDWVRHQPFALLAKRARRDLVFNDLYNTPDKYRGQLVALDLNVRRVLKYDFEGQRVYEVWGWTTESKTWLYVAVVLDLPQGMPIGADVYEKARLAGYFFKLQGYHEAGAKPHAKPLRTPLLLGRLEWEPTVEPVVQSSDWGWGLVLLGILAAVLVIRVGLLMVGKTRRKTAAATPVVKPLQPPAADDWLERVGAIRIGESVEGDSGTSEEPGNGKPGNR
jgi:hypothetical protein